jgi:hypothetical protein
MFTVIVLLVIAGALVYIGTRNKGSSSSNSSSGGSSVPSVDNTKENKN